MQHIGFPLENHLIFGEKRNRVRDLLRLLKIGDLVVPYFLLVDLVAKCAHVIGLLLVSLLDAQTFQSALTECEFQKPAQRADRIYIRFRAQQQPKCWALDHAALTTLLSW